jgi:hypothetical protein
MALPVDISSRTSEKTQNTSLIGPSSGRIHKGQGYLPGKLGALFSAEGGGLGTWQTWVGRGTCMLSLGCSMGDHCPWKVGETALLATGLAGPCCLHFPTPNAWQLTRPQAGARETAAESTRVVAGPNEGLAVQCPNTHMAQLPSPWEVPTPHAATHQDPQTPGPPPPLPGLMGSPTPM